MPVSPENLLPSSMFLKWNPLLPIILLGQYDSYSSKVQKYLTLERVGKKRHEQQAFSFPLQHFVPLLCPLLTRGNRQTHQDKSIFQTSEPWSFIKGQWQGPLSLRRSWDGGRKTREERRRGSVVIRARAQMASSTARAPKTPVTGSGIFCWWYSSEKKKDHQTI